MQNGWGVLKPIGDRLPYDLVADIGGKLAKIQVKSAWFDKKLKTFYCDARRTKTNRRVMLRSYYQPIDFDFAIIYIAVKHIFYVLPVEIFIGFRGSISFLEYGNKQRKAVSENYREAFDLISQWAAAKEISS